MMKKIIVASQNPVKIAAVKHAFERIFQGIAFKCEGVVINSGVSDQPVGDAETFSGAYNRTLAAKQIRPDADFWVGIEGGVFADNYGLAAFAWVVVQSLDNEGRSRSGTFYLPPKVASLVNNGVELGYANDQIFDKFNSKQNSGAIGILTNDVIDRQGLYVHAVILALTPFIKPELYPENKNIRNRG